MQHVRRVYGLARQIGLAMGDINLNILLPAAILHDIARKREEDLFCSEYP